MLVQLLHQVVVVVVGVVVVVVVGVVVVVAAVVVVGVMVETVGWPFPPVTVTVCGTGTVDVDGPSPGLVTRVVVVTGVLSELVRVSASPPTASAASAAAMPNSRGGRRYHGADATIAAVARSSVPRKTVGRSAVEDAA
jgi:hypothetical protein